MLMLQAAVLLLLLLGAVLLFNLNPFSGIRAEDVKKAYHGLLDRLRGRRRKTLRQEADRAQGKERKNFVQRNLFEARQVLILTNQQSKVTLMNRMCVVAFIIGAGIALAIRNVLMLPVLSIGCALIPMWYIRYSEFYFKKRLNNELEVALSVVTSSYMRTDNLIRSVEENLTYMGDPVRAAFAKLVNEVKYVDANVQNGIRNLRASINNPVFHDWCDILLLCAADRTYKQSLTPVVEQFADNKALQNSLETIIQQPVREFISIIAVVMITFPMLYMLNHDWFYTLTTTWGGRAIITALSVVLFAGMNKAIGLSAPIE